MMIKTRTLELSDRINWNSPAVKDHLHRKAQEQYYGQESRNPILQLAQMAAAFYHGTLRPMWRGVYDQDGNLLANEREVQSRALQPARLFAKISIAQEYDNERIQAQNKDFQWLSRENLPEVMTDRGLALYLKRKHDENRPTREKPASERALIASRKERKPFYRARCLGLR